MFRSRRAALLAVAFIVFGAPPLLVGFSGCPQPPAPQPPPVSDADASSPVLDSRATSGVTAACANLQAQGCPEGIPTCGSALQQALDARDSKKVTTATVDCVANAKTIAAIRACPSGWCPTSP